MTPIDLNKKPKKSILKLPESTIKNKTEIKKLDIWKSGYPSSNSTTTKGFKFGKNQSKNNSDNDDTKDTISQVNGDSKSTEGTLSQLKNQRKLNRNSLISNHDDSNLENDEKENKKKSKLSRNGDIFGNESGERCCIIL